MHPTQTTEARLTHDLEHPIAKRYPSPLGSNMQEKAIISQPTTTKTATSYQQRRAIPTTKPHVAHATAAKGVVNSSKETIHKFESVGKEMMNTSGASAAVVVSTRLPAIKEECEEDCGFRYCNGYCAGIGGMEEDDDDDTTLIMDTPSSSPSMTRTTTTEAQGVKTASPKETGGTVRRLGFTEEDIKNIMRAGEDASSAVIADEISGGKKKQCVGVDGVKGGHVLKYVDGLRVPLAIRRSAIRS